MHALAVGGELAPEVVAVAQGVGDVGERPEVGVVAGLLARECGVQRVVEVVAPLRVEAKRWVIPRWLR